MDLSGRLKKTFFISASIFLAECTGGLLSNSLALLSDAGHVLTDTFAIGLSLIAAEIAKRPSDFRATYGYHRFGLIAAVINGVSLVGISIYIFYESYRRFLNPQDIELYIMLPVAFLGLLGNLSMTLILGKGHEDLNIKSALLHVLGDTLSSIAVIISGLLIHLTGWRIVDPLTGILIGIIIIFGGLRVIKEALHIFLELTPPGFEPEEIVSDIKNISGVLDIHDVHLWAITKGQIAFSCHVYVKDQKLSELECLRKEIEKRLKDRGISHIIIQFECKECEEAQLYCKL
ncbi:MAG: cation diffusion facilitator family transporter [Thermodesulfovibrionales bacterium]|nr:cation diffusion facilitator family transporter [Thermodesulfovibrionales bacterium]